MKRLVILGAGGLAAETINLIEENNSLSQEWEILGCLNSGSGSNEPAQVLGYPILGDDSWLDGHTEELYAVCAVGNPRVRERIVQRCRKYHPNVCFPTLIHHNAQVSRHSRIGMGTIICSGVNITVNTNIGAFVIINLGSSVGHGSQIGPFSTLHPDSTVCGDVEIGALAEIGAGSTIIPGLKIGNGSIVGAGSTVVRDVPASVVAYGNPCRVMRDV